jgi:hypothetical protein
MVRNSSRGWGTLSILRRLLRYQSAEVEALQGLAG